MIDMIYIYLVNFIFPSVPEYVSLIYMVSQIKLHTFEKVIPRTIYQKSIKCKECRNEMVGTYYRA